VSKVLSTFDGGIRVTRGPVSSCQGHFRKPLRC
jgi:hypothetical protein